MTADTTPSPWAHEGGGTSIVDLLDRVVDRGAVVSGDVIVSLAGIDLIRIDLRLLLVGIEESLPAVCREPR